MINATCMMIKTKSMWTRIKAHISGTLPCRMRKMCLYSLEGPLKIYNTQLCEEGVCTPAGAARLLRSSLLSGQLAHGGVVGEEDEGEHGLRLVHEIAAPRVAVEVIQVLDRDRHVAASRLKLQSESGETVEVSLHGRERLQRPCCLNQLTDPNKEI